MPRGSQQRMHHLMLYDEPLMLVVPRKHNFVRCVPSACASPQPTTEVVVSGFIPQETIEIGSLRGSGLALSGDQLDEFRGEIDGAGWYENFEKPFWEDPSEHLRRSPIMYVGHVKTPTMLMTGVLDLRTPIPQSEEFYRALRKRGVPTVMVRMNNEYHGTTSTPSNFLRTQLYLRSWFDKYATKAASAATSSR